MTPFHEVTGPEDGAAVLFSAGLGGAGGFWGPQIAALSREYRVVSYDQAGTGRSGGVLPEGYSVADMADEAVAVLDAAGVDACHFVGHALGGLIGLELALRHPGRVRSLVPVNAWARLDPHTRHCFEVRLALLEHAGAEAYVRAQPLFLYPAVWLSANRERVEREHAHGLAHFQGAETLRRRVAALQGFDVSGRLAAIRCPVLVAASHDDVLVPWTASQRLAAALPRGRLWVVRGGGHGFTAIDPEPFNEGLLAFLAEH